MTITAEYLDTITTGDALEVMRAMPDNSIDLIATDPPYYRVKGEWWDKQWDKPAAFLAWIGKLCIEWQRILKPNGSLYVFASPQMAARVEVTIAERFNVLNRIIWAKWNEPGYDGWKQKADKESLRQYYPYSEHIIFAEQYGMDGYESARQDSETAWAAKNDVRKYLDDERRRADVPHRIIIRELGMAGHDTHFFSPVQWKLPTKEQYEKMREIFHHYNHGSQYLEKGYEYLTQDYEFLRQDYTFLKQEYEDLRRPFAVSADVPYTDVWTFQTVKPYEGKHPCEKPGALMSHIVAVSSRPGAVVLDCFAGSGSTLFAAIRLKRRAIGIEIDARWCDRIRRRLEIPEQMEMLP